MKKVILSVVMLLVGLVSLVGLSSCNDEAPDFKISDFIVGLMPSGNKIVFSSNFNEELGQEYDVISVTVNDIVYKDDSLSVGSLWACYVPIERGSVEVGVTSYNLTSVTFSNGKKEIVVECDFTATLQLL